MALEEFKNHFYSEYNQINDLLNDLNIDNNSANATELKLSISSKYETISNRTEILQKYFTQSTSFIPIYEVRKAQEHLAKLNRLAQEKRDLIFPKKKFGFKSKQNMVTLESAIETAINKTTSSLANQSNADDKSKKFNIESSCTIRDIDNQTIIKYDSEINGKDVGLINAKNSCIQLYGNPSVLHISDLENVTLLCGPITGSAFINNCKNSKLVIACHQLRIHETEQTEFYINVVSRAIIENCKNVKFAPYAWSYKNIEEHFKMSSIKYTDINWTAIDDFNWLNQNVKSPNWDFLEELARTKWSTNENSELKIEN
jgi:hypothetical protein